MFRAPAMLLPHESTVAHEQHFAAENANLRYEDGKDEREIGDRRILKVLTKIHLESCIYFVCCSGFTKNTKPNTACQT